MIEGSQIDWGVHNNDSDYMILETLGFDKVVNIFMLKTNTFFVFRTIILYVYLQHQMNIWGYIYSELS